MLIRKVAKIFVILLLTFLITLILYSKYFKKEEISDQKKIIIKENVYKSNIIKDVNYTTKDADGNEYSINAKQAEIDLSDTNILFLTDVKAFIKLRNSEIISITSDYGKYNADNFDTIFSKNVLINYLDNKINGEYLDFSYERNSMIISKKVVFTNIQNILEADVIEINIKTKDTKIFMHENEKKVNIKSKNLNGNN